MSSFAVDAGGRCVPHGRVSGFVVHAGGRHALRKWMGRLAADAGGVRIVWAEWRAARAGGQLSGACRRDDTPRGRVDISRRKGLGADA